MMRRTGIPSYRGSQMVFLRDEDHATPTPRAVIVSPLCKNAGEREPHGEACVRAAQDPCKSPQPFPARATQRRGEGKGRVVVELEWRVTVHPAREGILACPLTAGLRGLS